jgi:UDP-glucose 4-epimerase
MKSKRILVTGGAGYIGSHMVRMLLEEGLEPIVIDSLETGHRVFVPKKVKFFKGDLRKKNDIQTVFKRCKIDAVIHFAASLIVPESMVDPIKYYDNNIASTLNLVQSMREANVKKMIFSSTAAVYGDVKKVPVREDAPTVPESPYGMSKLMSERILEDIAKAHDLRYIILRYFNVAGSHEALGIGIRHSKVTHLIPSVLRVANRRQKKITIFGNDYKTHDGSCIRDYIYVVDLCRAHLCGLQGLDRGVKSDVFNLGCGNGFSVKEVIETARAITGKTIPITIGQRRPGDPPKVVASSRKAERILKWKPQATLRKIIQTSWDWERAEAQREKDLRKKE